MLGQSGSDAVTAALKTARSPPANPASSRSRAATTGSATARSRRAACARAGASRSPISSTRTWRFAPYPRSDGRSRRVARRRGQGRSARGRRRRGARRAHLGRGGCVVPPADFLPELRGAHTARGRAAHRRRDLDRPRARRACCSHRPRPASCPISSASAKGSAAGCPSRRASAPTRSCKPGGASPPEEVVHTATFHGAPLACATAIATLDALRSEKLDVRARRGGRTLEGSVGVLALSRCPAPVRCAGAG